MKQLEELEEKFLNEIKPLVNQFIEYKKQEMSNFAKETTDIRIAITDKTSEFKKTYTEIWNTEISEKTKEANRQEQELLEERKSILQLRDEIVKRNGAIDQEKDKVLYQTQQEEIQKYKKMKQEYDKKLEEYKSNIGQLEELKKAQKEFEERYGSIDYITEGDVYRLDILIGKKEDMETVRMSGSQVYDENGKVVDMKNIMDMEQKADEELKQDKEKELEQLREKVSKMFDEKQKEFDTYWEQKMRDFDEVEAKVDEELREEARQKELNIQEDKKEQDVPKKGRIRRLWEKAKSFFKRKVIPALIEPIEQEPEETDTFKKELTKDSPPPEKQVENSKEFINREKNTETEQKMSDVLTILD